MPTSQLDGFLRRLRAVTLHEASGVTDAQLLESFITSRDEAAFAALVRRHGPMVWGVCRRVLGQVHDAEDAFQATFLVLVRKATAVLPRAMVGNWLYGVAYRTAMKARATSIKRRAKEKQVEVMPEPPTAQQDLQRDLLPKLDQELDRLPNKYRAAVVLCDLQGKTHKEAARQLGWPVGTLSTRLVRGRAILAKRLARHGLAISGGALAMMLSGAQNASASVPSSVVYSTIKVATLVAAGKATAGVISVKVAALTEGVLKMMLLSKLRMTTAVLLIVALTGVAVVTLAAGGGGDDQTGRNVRTTAERRIADAQKEDAAKNDELQGAWEVMAVVQDGKQVEERFFDGQVWVFTGNMLKGVSGKMTYTLDPSQKPKAIDVTYKSSRQKGEVVTNAGIYELKGDELRIVLRAKGGDRPKEFDAKDANTTLTVLKRLKIGAAPAEKPPTVNLRQGNRYITLFPNRFATHAEGQMLAMLGDCSVSNSQVATEDRWSAILKGDHVHIVYPKPRPLTVFVHETGQGKDEVWQVSEIVVPMSSEKFPDYIFVRSESGYGAFAKYGIRETQTFQKLIKYLVEADEPTVKKLGEEKP